MRISEKEWKKYVDKMAKINSAASNLMKEWIKKHGFGDDKALLDYAYSLTSHYGEAIGELACQMYEEIADAQGVIIPPAEIAELPEYGEVAKAVHGTMNTSLKLVPSTIGRLVKQVGADTTLKNAIRDRAEFAWVPNGDTCAFCITLASRGWQRTSKKSMKNGHAIHIHAHCNCEYAVRFDSESTIEGYDPEKYLEMYKNADPNGNYQSKINALRRQMYAEKKQKEIKMTQ